MASEFRTDTHPSSPEHLLPFALTEPVFRLSVERNLNSLSSTLGDMAEIAFYAAEGHIPTAMRISRARWMKARDQVMPKFALDPGFLCQTSGRDWRPTLTLGFTPLQARRAGLLETGPWFKGLGECQ